MHQEKRRKTRFRVSKGPLADLEITSHAITDEKTRIGAHLTSQGQVSSPRCFLLDRNENMRALVYRSYKSGTYHKRTKTISIRRCSAFLSRNVVSLDRATRNSGASFPIKEWGSEARGWKSSLGLRTKCEHRVYWTKVKKKKKIFVLERKLLVYWKNSPSKPQANKIQK